MIEEIKAALSGIAATFSDTREQLMDVEVEELNGSQLTLKGRVLDTATLDALRHRLQAAFPDMTLDVALVSVLRQPGAAMLSVNTNLTGFYAAPSFLAEPLSEQMWGWPLEVVEEKERWVFVRQEDGYLGWVYRPYLREEPPQAPTHLAMTPVVQVLAEPRTGAAPVGRLLGGTAVAVLAEKDDFAMLDFAQPGWVPLSGLRAFSDLPKTEEERRAAMMKDIVPMIGVPYQWGGCSANGIDCSGLAQLLHRWVGITTRRDAGMQFLDGKPIEPPFAPGDLVFFGDVTAEGKHNITHVGISVGGWQIVHSSRARNGVYYDDVQAVPHLRDSTLCACTYLAG